MPTLRIVKEMVGGVTNGIVVTDRVEFKSRDDGAAFVRAVNANPARYGFKITDHSWLLIGEGAPEVLVNPTGGRVGKL